MLTTHQMFDEVMAVICDNIKNDDFNIDTSIIISLKSKSMKIIVSSEISLEGLNTTALNIEIADKKTIISYSV